MRCMLDTNILISASLFPGSIADRVFTKAVTYPNVGVICDYCIDEMRRVYDRKFPLKIQLLEQFLAIASLSAEIVATPPESESVGSEASIRDVKDRAILRAAVASGVDALITGDKDFLESGLTTPKIFKPADFLNI